MSWVVYKICDSRGKLRYVGSTSDLDLRLKRHLQSSQGKKRTPFADFVAKCVQQGKKLRVFVVAEYEVKSDALSHERRLIAENQGDLLLNVVGNRIGNARRVFRERRKAASEVA